MILRPGQTLADGRPIYAGTAKRPNPNFGAINLIHSGTTSNFNGLFLTLQKRLSKGLEFTANYMYSHALDNNIGEGGSISDPSNLRRDYGNADSDIRHNFVFQGHFELSTMTYQNSGFPINVIAGTDLNNDGVINDRPLFESRNSFRGRGFSQVSAQVKRYFNIGERVHLAAFIGAENLLNSNNLNCNTTTGCTGAVVNAANASNLFHETSAGTARNVQLGASLKF